MSKDEQLEAIKRKWRGQTLSVKEVELAEQYAAKQRQAAADFCALLQRQMAQALADMRREKAERRS